MGFQIDRSACGIVAYEGFPYGSSPHALVPIGNSLRVQCPLSRVIGVDSNY